MVTALTRPDSERIQARVVICVVTLICLLPVHATAQEDSPWGELRRNLNTKLDRSLESLAGFAQLDAGFRTHSDRPQSWSRLTAQRVEAKLSDTTAPEPVLQFVQFFSGPGQTFYQKSAERLRSYRSVIQEVFKREGVSADLIWIGLVESGYDPNARSARNAVGIWQLTPETASQYGLFVREGTDERTDAMKSTLAAARFLRHLYNVFQDWNLVLAAYNSGEDRVLQAVARAGTADFWELARRKLLPEETRNYVPAVLAAIELEHTSVARP